MTGDPSTGNNLQILPRQFKGWDNADVGGSGKYLIGAARGNPEVQFEQALLRPVEHSPDQGSGIEITDCAHAQPAGRVLGQSQVYQTPR